MQNPDVDRQRFAENVASFLRMLYFDGIIWQGSGTDSEDFVELLKVGVCLVIHKVNTLPTRQSGLLNNYHTEVDYAVSSCSLE